MLKSSLRQSDFFTLDWQSSLLGFAMPTTFTLIGLFNMLYILNILFANYSLSNYSSCIAPR